MAQFPMNPTTQPGAAVSKPTVQDIINASNRASNELLKTCPFHDQGYSVLEEHYFHTMGTVRELNRVAVRAKKARA